MRSLCSLVPGPGLALAAAAGAAVPAAAGAAPGGPSAALEAGAQIGLCCPATADGASRCRDGSALERLAAECHRRTSLAVWPGAAALPLTAAALRRQPLLLWQGTGGEPPLAPEQAAALGQWLLGGGMLLVDGAEAEGSASRAAFLRTAERSLSAALGSAALLPVAPDDVLFRSFYLMTPGAPALTRPLGARGLRIQGRLAVVVTEQPWLSAIAVAPGGEAAAPEAAPAGEREGRLRMAINWLMYALCLNYKDDQVHLPYLLERRGH